MYQTQRILHGEDGFSRNLQEDENQASVQALINDFEKMCKMYKGYYALWSLVVRDKPNSKSLDLPHNDWPLHRKQLLVILDENSIPLKEKRKNVALPEYLAGGNLKEKIIDKLQDLNDERLISTIAFGIIPSYYSFFIHEQQFEDFLDFINLFEDDNQKIIFSTALFCSPIVVNFIHDVFSPIFRPFCQATKPLSCLKIKNIQKQLLNSLNANKFNFPTTLKQFINHFYQSNKVKQKQFAIILLKTNLFKKIIQFPEAFQVFDIGLLEFHPETKEICNKMEKIFDDKFISNFLEIILEIKVNNICYVSKEIDPSIGFSIFLDPFDLAFIDFAKEFIKNEENEKSLTFNDYFDKCDKYYFVKINRSSFEPERKAFFQSTQQFGSLDSFHFRKLLKESPPLPPNYMVPNKMNVIKLIKKFLLQTNDPFTSGKQISHFNIIKSIPHYEKLLIATNFDQMIRFHDEESIFMQKILKTKNEIAHIYTFINNISYTPKDTITNIAFLISLREVEFGDIQKQIHKIVQDPSTMRVNFYKFNKNAIEYTEKLGIGKNNYIQAKLNILNYRRFFSHNRFIEFIGQRPELIENDKIISSLISSNYHHIIKMAVEEELSEQIIPNSYLFEIPAQLLRDVFSENIDPLVKLEKINQSLKMAKSIYTREFGDNTPEIYAQISQFLFAFSNPPNFFSNYVFLLDYIFSYQEFPENERSYPHVDMQSFFQITISCVSKDKCATSHLQPHFYSPIYSANVTIIIGGDNLESRNFLAKYIVESGGCIYDQNKQQYNFEFQYFDSYLCPFLAKCRLILFEKKDLQNVEDDYVLMLYGCSDKSPSKFSPLGGNNCNSFFNSFKGKCDKKTIYIRPIQSTNQNVINIDTREILDEIKQWLLGIKRNKNLS
ncbi:hypothetical protein TRFO_38527 [Tritrichomonas foetus]|uniref:Uncharacterized protein n=1 Tax=Tritrichomonas foetus TaxID=1144522 RepID=A0A1J4J9M0_9EUKA|nr:hypothetical protein TRFO_38527 [Tritrichomonas foetus]|eukprot:OHS95361.1 hypothetical protein TRFO_38527 [Tritrichomonas foetus]